MSKRGNGEGSVYQEGARTGRRDGRWVAQVYNDEGKLRRKFASTEAIAKKLLLQMQMAAERDRTLIDGNATVGQLLQDWRTRSMSARNLSPRTERTYSWAVDVLIEEIGSVRLRRLTPEVVEAALVRLAREGRRSGSESKRSKATETMGRSSLIKIRSVLGKALEYAERRGVVSRNVARVVELPRDARRPEPGRALTVEQARHLIDVTSTHRLEGLWHLMLMLGLRPGEATGLTWPDVDLDAGVVHVRHSLKLEHGALVLDERLKTSRSRRSLDAPDTLVASLRRHRGRQSAERLAAGPLWTNPDDLVFTTTTGTPIHPENLRRTFARITESAGLGRWHPHELRHSAASIMSAAGLPLEQVADVLGHDGTRMTALVYRHAVTPTVAGGRIMQTALA